MRKKLVALLFVGALALSIVACSGESGSSSNDASKTETTEESQPEVTYQTILDDYTKQIQDATPGLIEEYNSESADITNDLNALAELSNSKVEKLAEICNTGVEEMAELMTKNGDEYETYEEWAGKLRDVYMEYSKQITDAYTNSTSGMSTEDLMNSLESLQ